MDKNDIFSRLSYLVDFVADGNIAKFARIINSGDQTLRSIIKYKRNYPGYELLSNIIHAFEWINIEWLIIGKGEMRKESSHDPGNGDEHNKSRLREDRLLSIIESQQRSIEYLSKKGGLNGEGMISESTRKTS